MINVRNKKGQSIVEFAMLLAFVAVIGLFARDGGLLDDVGSVFDPAAYVLEKVDHYRTFDVAPSIDSVIGIQTNGNYKQGNAGANNVNYLRGMMRSSWVDKNPTDAAQPEIANLYEELGATQWTVYTGAGSGYTANLATLPKPNDGKIYYGDKGIMWTVQELGNAGLTPNNAQEGINYSNELVLQYFYSTVTHKYYVIKSRVWVNQRDTANGIALGGFHQQQTKPAGYFVDGCLDGFDTLLDAQKLFERVLKENGGSVVFLEADPEHDVSAENHVFTV